MIEPLRILLVDNDGHAAKMRRSFLAGQGHECQVASSVATAVEVARQFKPDIILYDLGIPGNSSTLPGLIRQFSDFMFPLLIAMSDRTDVPTRRQLFEYGVFLLLAKPLDSAYLVRILARVMPYALSA